MADPTPPRARSLTRADGVALKEHMEVMLAAQKCYFEARIAALEKASDVATNRLQERLAGMNEFRMSLSDLSNQMATREEVTLQMDRIKADISDLKRSRDEQTGKASQSSVVISMLIGVSGLIISIISLFLR